MWGHQRETRADNDCLTIISGRSCSNKPYQTILNLSNQQSLRKFWWRDKSSLMFYVMTGTDLLTFSSNQTWETWTSLNPLKTKGLGLDFKITVQKKNPSIMMSIIWIVPTLKPLLPGSPSLPEGPCATKWKWPSNIIKEKTFDDLLAERQLSIKLSTHTF